MNEQEQTKYDQTWELAKPDSEGQTHINSYSKSRTEIGKFLSNFAYSPIKTEDGGFLSIEGYWYWLLTGAEELRTMVGWKAKQTGRGYDKKDWDNSEEFKRKIKAAIKLKIMGNPKMKTLLQSNKLPIIHYYEYYGKIIVPKNGQWLWTYIEELRENL